MKKLLFAAPILIVAFLLMVLGFSINSSPSVGSKQSAEIAWGKSGMVYIYLKDKPRIKCRGFLIGGDKIRTAKHCFQEDGIVSAEFISNDSPGIKRNLVPPVNLGAPITLMRNAPSDDVIDVTIENPIPGIGSYDRPQNSYHITKIFYFESKNGSISEQSCGIFVKDRLGVSKDCHFEKGYSGMPVFYVYNGEYKFAGIYNGFFSGTVIGLSDDIRGFYSIVF